MADDQPKHYDQHTPLRDMSGAEGTMIDMQEEDETRVPYCKSYDAVELSCCVLIWVVGIVFELTSSSPHQRPIPFQQLESSGEFIENQIYSQEHVEETVSSTQLILYAFLAPFLGQLLLSRCMGSSDTHKTACVYFAAFGLTLLLTDAVKQYVGYLRPIFYAICEPDENYEECTSGDDDEARRSFPSGHSSWSFCGLTLLSLYLEHRFGVSSIRALKLANPASGEVRIAYKQPVRLYRIVSIACFLPILVAFYVAASRVVDNMHHPADVVGGSVLGATVAVFVHGLWYPSMPSMQ